MIIQWRVQDTWQAMEKLVDEGLVKSIGISNFSVPKTKELQSYARIKPVVNQVEIHPFWRNDKLVEYAQSSNVRPVAPLCFVLAWQAMGAWETACILHLVARTTMRQRHLGEVCAQLHGVRSSLLEHRQQQEGLFLTGTHDPSGSHPSATDCSSCPKKRLKA